jgi:hypothetical protein
MPEPQNDIPEGASICEDEVNLIDYCRIVWKYKLLILLGSVLPTLIAGLTLMLWAKSYKVTYTYDLRDRYVYDEKYQNYGMRDCNLDEKNYYMLLEKIYSQENMDKVITKLRENGLGGYIPSITRAPEGLRKFVYFEVWPSYKDIARAQTADLTESNRMARSKAQLLNMTILGKSKNDILKISPVIRDNLENVLSLYTTAEQLKKTTTRYRTKISGIEEDGFSLQLALSVNKSTLEKLKNVKIDSLYKSQSNLPLQFDIGEKTEYLPVEYQIQAVESKIIQLEEEIKASVQECNYYRDLLALSNKMLSYLNDKTTSYFTIRQFQSYVGGLLDRCQSKELKDYLNSWLRKIEDIVSATTAVTEKPKIYPVPDGTVKKTAIVFVISLIISVFAVFLLEAARKHKSRAGIGQAG